MRQPSRLRARILINMKRWPFHPILRFVLAFVLIGWVLVVSYDADPGDRGWLTSLVGRVVAPKRNYTVFYQTMNSGPESIEFSLQDDGTIDARFESVSSPQDLPVLQDGIPIASVFSPPSRYVEFGLIYPAFETGSTSSTIIWHIPKDEYGYNDQTLEDALDPYRRALASPNGLRVALNALIDNPLLLSRVLMKRMPLQSNQSYIAYGPSQLVGELLYYFVFIWWLLTLRYARRVWPKPDGSRCPSCNYPTAGLTTPTCPECGNPIPNAPHA